jgi:hypothetical protein
LLLLLLEAGADREADREVWRDDDDGLTNGEPVRDAEAGTRSFPGRIALDWRNTSSRVFCCRSSRSEWPRAR